MELIAGRQTALTKVRYIDSAYHITARDVVPDSQLEFKFDTGAISSFVTVGSMLGKNNVEKNRESINRAFEHYGEIGKLQTVFHSASDNEMFAYRVYAEDVMIGNIKLPIFYYWLSPMIDNRKLLLGDDFIRFCDFKHVHESDIIIEDFKVDD